MKKLYTLAAAGLLFSATASAQRLIDLGVTLTSPVTNATITSGTAFPLNFVVTNTGTTPLKASDTVLFEYFLDNSGIDFTGSGSATIYFRTGKLLNPNDTMMINRNVTFTFPATANGVHTLGAVAVVYNMSADSAKDGNVTNNLDTSNVVFGDGSTTGVQDIQASVVNNKLISLYPNPATDRVNAQIELSATENVSLRLIDLMGKTILVKDMGKLNKGVHTLELPLNNMTTGYYFYQIKMGSATATEKIYVK